MRYPVDGKNISIPDEYIEKNMRNLGITRQECVDMYLSDEGIKVDPAVVEMTEKAKAAGTGAKATGEGAKRKPPVRKEDPVKRAFIDAMGAFLAECDPAVMNVEVLNPERMLGFEYLGEKYEVTLTRKRKPKSQ